MVELKQFEDDHAFEEFEDETKFNDDHAFEEFEVENEFKDDHAFEEFEVKNEFDRVYCVVFLNRSLCFLQKPLSRFS